MSLFVVLALAQAAVASPAPAPSPRIIGPVIERAEKSVTVQTGPGERHVVNLDEKTACLRTEPGASSLSTAAKIPCSAVQVGDRVWARGLDSSTSAARQIVVMTQSDIVQKQEREREEWRRRGIVGVITAIDPTTRTITLRMRESAEAPTLVLDTSRDTVTFRRYAPGSVKFGDARVSRFEDLKINDQVRALGERSADGQRFVADQVVSGVFRTIGGVIVSIDPTRNEIVLKDWQSQQPVTVVLHKDSTLRRLPAEIATRFANRGDSAGRPSPPPGAPASSRRRAGSEWADRIEQLPTVVLADLKSGDALLVSSTEGEDPSRVTAITVLSGVEPLLAAPSVARGGSAPSVDSLGLPAGLMDMGLGN